MKQEKDKTARTSGPPPTQNHKTTDQKDTAVASWKTTEFLTTFSPYTTKLRDPAPGQRATPALWDICNGCILWLPKTYDQSKMYGRCPPRGVLDHPILVLHVAVSSPEDAVVTFATMRSGVDESHPWFWNMYMKIAQARRRSPSELIDGIQSVDLNQESPVIAPSPPPPPDANLLFIEKERGYGSMKEKSYVCLSAVYRVEWQELQCYAIIQKPDGYRHRLNEVSFSKLYQRMGNKLAAPQQEWVPSDKLWETFDRKYITRVGGENGGGSGSEKGEKERSKMGDAIVKGVDDS